MSEFKYNLGSEVKDKITGYSGIIRGRSQYLTGCNTYGIQSRELKDSRPHEWVWVDEDLIHLIKDKEIDLSSRPEKGGPLSKDQYPPSR